MTRLEMTPLLAASLLGTVPAAASETATYTYDVFGRLTAVSTAGGPGDGTAVSTAYDPAGNRTSYGVAGAGAAGQMAPASGSTPEMPPPTEDATAEQPAQESPAMDGAAQPEDPGGAGGAVQGGTPKGGR